MGSQGAAPEGIISGKNHPEEPKEGTIITQKLRNYKLAKALVRP